MPHSALPSHLRVDGVSFSYPDRRVLTDVTLTVSAGERVGLIGENGSGKSTLLRIAADLLTPDAGTVTAPRTRRGASAVGLLHQQPPFDPEERLHHVIETAVAPARAAAQAVASSAEKLGTTPESASAQAGYAAALAEAERLDAWETDSKIASMLAGLGLANLSHSTPVGDLSGGQRARVSLAWLLLHGPDVLLLDEPTNHLDDAATAHLHRTLLGWNGPVLIASHDRAFLDETVTSLVDLDPTPTPEAVVSSDVHDDTGSGLGITRFTGAYTDYLAERAGARQRWQRQYREEQAQLRRLQAAVGESHTVGHAQWRPRTEVRAAAKYFADRNARAVSRRVTDAKTRLETLQRDQLSKPPGELRFAGIPARPDRAPTQQLPGPVLQADSASRTGRLAPVTLTVGQGDKWLITGPNGSGKSTLLQLLAGHLEPSTGQIHRKENLRFGLLTQNTDLPDPYEKGPGRTAQDCYIDAVGRARAEEHPLRDFGLLAIRDENRPLRALSVGQQRRLMVAILLADPPEVLLLDEPTNHLSLLVATDLEAAIETFPGAVVLVSHDRWLRRRWAGQHLNIEAINDDHSRNRTPEEGPL